jgi:hypothetical protein
MKARYEPVVVLGDRIRHVDGVWEVVRIDLVKFSNGNSSKRHLYTMRLVEDVNGVPLDNPVEWSGAYEDLPKKFIDGDGK